MALKESTAIEAALSYGTLYGAAARMRQVADQRQSDAEWEDNEARAERLSYEARKWRTAADHLDGAAGALQEASNSVYDRSRWSGFPIANA